MATFRSASELSLSCTTAIFGWDVHGSVCHPRVVFSHQAQGMVHDPFKALKAAEGAMRVTAAEGCGLILITCSPSTCIQGFLTQVSQYLGFINMWLLSLWIKLLCTHAKPQNTVVAEPLRLFPGKSGRRGTKLSFGVLFRSLRTSSVWFWELLVAHWYLYSSSRQVLVFWECLFSNSHYYSCHCICLECLKTFWKQTYVALIVILLTPSLLPPVALRLSKASLNDQSQFSGSMFDRPFGHIKHMYYDRHVCFAATSHAL